MKTFVLLALSATLSLGNATQTNARTIEHTYVLAGTTVNISADENVKAVTVNINKIQNDVVNISLESEEGTILFTEEVSKVARYSKKLNLSQLENGSYRLVVKKNLSKTIQPFEITDAGVKLNENDRKEKFLPIVIQKGASVNVNCLTSNYTNMFVRIYDNSGKLVFEDANYVIFRLHKSFNLSNLTAGVYIVEVVAGDETQYTTVNL